MYKTVGRTTCNRIPSVPRDIPQFLQTAVETLPTNLAQVYPVSNNFPRIFYVFAKSKSKVRPSTAHEGSEGEHWYASTLS